MKTVWLALVLAAAFVHPPARAQDCPADFAAPFGQLDFFDVLEYLGLFAAEDPAADLAPPFGSWDFFDVLQFLSDFADGCPEPDPFPGDPNPNASHESEPAIPDGAGCTPMPLHEAGDRWINGVRLFSGETYQTSVDMVVRGRGFDFVWVRKYRSQLGPHAGIGHRWDYSYNLFVTEDGADLVLHNGWGRQDRYVLQPDGSWTATGFFRVIRQQPDGSYVLDLANGSIWAFAPIDGSPAEGRVVSISDRNANIMSFGYDPIGRLVTVTDTLGRAQQIVWYADGTFNDYIAMVRDHTGREVVYTYHAAGHPDGGFGDLASCRSPVVVGTPNGNDFPLGKTTTYTYTTGQADERLDHLLRTVTDPNGSTYLVNEYAGATDPADPLFARLVRQIWGDPGDVIDLTYVAQTPSPANGGAVIKVILNDRAGNVRESYFDEYNNGVMSRELTGLADPDMPTTETTNRPGPPLRVDDPLAYETRWTYNADALVTEVVKPGGNSMQLEYDSLNPDARARGNLLLRRLLPGPLGGDQPELVETFEYLPTFGGCGCGPQFVTSHVDRRGNQTTYTYDDFGNRLRADHRLGEIVENWEYNAFGQVTAYVHPDNGSGHRRRDEFAHYAAGPQTGYLQAEIQDAPGLALTTTYEYDARGNVVRAVDPRGHDSLIVVNALDQAVREIGREVADGTGIRYVRDLAYDDNDNLVRLDVENRDADGNLGSDTHYTITREYEILNMISRATSEMNAGNDIVEEFLYDTNRLRTLRRAGEATNGNQPANTERVIFDERYLPFQKIRAEGSSDQSTTQFDYDLNGNAKRKTTGIESAPRSRTYAYDGYDRLVSVADPLGNATLNSYDAQGNLIHQRIEGELDDMPGQTGNLRLHEADHAYDAMDRWTGTGWHHFDTATQTPILDGLASVTAVLSPLSAALQQTDDNGNTTVCTYDTLNRLATKTDAKGNQTRYAYDANSNVVAVTEIEKSDLGSPDQTYETSYEYDNLDRRTAVIDPGGDRSELAYDSRDNVVRRTDGRGNVSLMDYDERDLLVRVETVLTDTGDGMGAVIGGIVTTFEWDDSRRCVARTDGELNTTAYQYDALDRCTGVVYADGTTASYAYDPADNLVQETDPNGSVLVNTHDLNNRLVRRDVTPGPGVAADTLLERYRHDGLSRVVRASDEDAVIEFEYDSLSDVTVERLNGRATTSSWDGARNLVSCAYPGGRVITRAYDQLNRTSAISDQFVTLATFDYVGPRRVERKTYPKPSAMASIETAYSYAPDRLPVRITATRDPGGAPAVIDDRAFAWDAADNRTARAGLLPGQAGWDFDYTYDSANRLVTSTLTRPGQGAEPIQYTLDEANNRTVVAGGPQPGTYTLDAGPSMDKQVNQYTTTPFDSRTYDLNGNLVQTDDGGGVIRQFIYDYRDRMVAFSDLSSGVTAAYTYDALGRRTSKTVIDGPAQTTNYYYAGLQVCEEQDENGVTTATYVYGRGIDDVIHMRRGATSFFYHGDHQGNVMAVTDNAGTVAARHEYRDFGDPIIFLGLQGGDPYLFNGRRYDAETGFYYYRTRYQDPGVGRFVSRDTIGIWGDPHARGNGFTYAGNNPWTLYDPMGTYTWTSEYCYGTYLHFKFNDCTSSSRRSKLENRTCNAYKAAKDAHYDVYGSWQPSSGWLSTSEGRTVYSRMLEWFTTGGVSSGSLSRDNQETIHDVFHDVYYEWKDETIKIECETSSHSNCDTWGSGSSMTGVLAFVNYDAYIHICPFFWNSLFTADDRELTMFHEGTHEYAGTDDHGYYTSLTGSHSYVLYDSSGSSYSVSLSSSELRDNADTYSGFVDDFGYLP